MRAFLAVSVAPGAAPDTISARLPSAIKHLPAGTAATLAETHRTPDGWIAVAGAEPDDECANPAKAFTVRLGRAVRTCSGDVDAASLATMMGNGRVDGHSLAELLPPFAAAHRAGPDEPVVVAGDWLGMRQVFWWQGEGVAAVCTSALALAVLAGARLRTEALGVQSLVGWQLGLDTLFTGVTKLAPGSFAVLRTGFVDVRQYVEPSLSLAGDPPPVTDLVDELAQILRDLHTSYLSDHPDTVLQLSGGQDSRILLCAIPPALRRGLPAFTLGVHGDADSTVATRLAAATSLDHRVHWLDEQPAVDTRSGYGLALQASAALDCMASPMALGPLILAERGLAQGHRLSGAGGEMNRGFFYPGQPRHATTSPQLVSKLADWRLFGNEAVAEEALTADFVTTARTGTIALLAEHFAGYSPEWLRATDEFYLFQRTQRWAGAHGSAAAVDRFFINPLLDRRFIQLTLAADPADKRDSRLSGLLMSRLDPALAAIPLDSGLVPAQLGRGGMGTSVAVARVKARKAAAKVRQRLVGARRAQLGAAGLARLVVNHWRAEPDAAAPLRRSGVVREAWLDELLAGHREASAATVAFLVNMLVASEALSGSAAASE
jgi:asparagine synthase (glutamine-hydrolysing)